MMREWRIKLYINILQDTRSDGSYDTSACFEELEEVYHHILKIESRSNLYYRRCRYRGTLIINGTRLRLVNLRWDALEQGDRVKELENLC